MPVVRFSLDVQMRIKQKKRTLIISLLVLIGVLIAELAREEVKHRDRTNDEVFAESS